MSHCLHTFHIGKHRDCFYKEQLIDYVLCGCRGAYNNNTVPGSKPYNDALDITVSYTQLVNMQILYNGLFIAGIGGCKPSVLDILAIQRVSINPTTRQWEDQDLKNILTELSAGELYEKSRSFIFSAVA